MTRGAELERVTREGKRLRTEILERRWMASPRGHPRVGFIVPKHSQTAVARNRLKRRLREIARREMLSVLGSVDVIIRARPVAYRLGFVDLRREMAGAAERLAVALGQR